MDKLNRLGRRRDAAFDEKNYYEAHQISRTIYNRLLTMPEVEASSVLRYLFETRFNKHVSVGEITSALDLGELFVNTLINRVTDDGDVEAGRVLDEFVTLFSNCPPTLNCDERTCEDDGEGKFDPLVERRNQLLNRVLNWTTAKANAAAEAQRIKDSPPPQPEDEAVKSAPASSETRKEAEMDLD